MKAITKIPDETTFARWRATVWYRCENGEVSVEHDLHKLADIHDLVERGPHWDTITNIQIVRVGHVDGDDLTVEGAQRL